MGEGGVIERYPVASETLYIGHPLGEGGKVVAVLYARDGHGVTPRQIGEVERAMRSG